MVLRALIVRKILIIQKISVEIPTWHVFFMSHVLVGLLTFFSHLEGCQVPLKVGPTQPPLPAVDWSVGAFYFYNENLLLPPGRRPYGPEAGPGQSAAGLALPTEEISGIGRKAQGIIKSFIRARFAPLRPASGFPVSLRCHSWSLSHYVVR